jgi:hypothetical protein
VESQKPRDGHHVDDTFGECNKDMEKEAGEEIPLGRKNTDHLLASNIVQQKQQAQHEEDHHYGLAYLFKRMFIIIRDHWKLYTMSLVFACCMYLFISLVYLFSDGHSSQRNGLSRPWDSFCHRYRWIFPQ